MGTWEGNAECYNRRWIFFFFLTDKPFHFLEFKIPGGIIKSRKYPPIDFHTSPVAILSHTLGLKQGHTANELEKRKPWQQPQHAMD